METSFAIYEFLGLILALPLSYFLAYLARKHTNVTYKDELDKLFTYYWNGEREDELNAWLKVKRLLSSRKLDPKREKYISKKIREINKSEIYGSTKVGESGITDENENLKRLKV